MTAEEFKLHQGIKFWNIVFTVFFVLVNIFGFWLFMQNQLFVELEFISFFEILVLSLAVFRTIRLFVYDNITLFLREAFMDKKVVDGKYFFEESQNSLKRTIYKLLLCPWCFGVWSASIIVFVYFIVPELRIFVYILAVASVASVLQIFSNWIGWSAEEKKLKVQNI